MAAPAYAEASAGAVATAVGGLAQVQVAGAVGDLLILQVLQDGTATAPTLDFTGGGIVEDLAGTDDAFTAVGVFDVGSPAVGKQHLWIGRTAALTSGFVDAIAVCQGDDIYVRLYRFTGVHTGTTLADVIENSTAGTATNGVGNVIDISDTGVTTLGADRLALNFVGVNDDNVLDAFTGMTGGTWAELVAEYATATGTDGAIGIQGATIAAAGTIDGGTDTMAIADPWGVVGFALIPAGAATPASLIYQPGLQVATPRSLYVR